MIKINLLPVELSKKARPRDRKRASSAFAPLLLLLFAFYGVVGYGGYLLYKTNKDWQQRVLDAEASQKRKEQILAKKQEQYYKEFANAEEIEAKYEVAMALSPENRLFWSEKINMIGRARMNLAVYVTKLQLNEKIEEVETPESIKRREEWRALKEKPKNQPKEPAAVKRPIIQQWLNIDAIAYGTDSPQQLRQINAFHDNLVTMTWERESGKVVRFMDFMQGEFGQLEHKRDTVGGVEILRFGFICRAAPQHAGTQTTTGTQTLAVQTTGTATGTAATTPTKGGR